jgi:hypothetical protein
MYLACKEIKGRTHYFIRKSYRHGEYFLSRELIDLGMDPGQYIVYPGGNSFFIDEIIEDRLDELGIKTDQEELENIFWRFLNPEIQRVLEHFRRRERRSKTDSRERRSTENFQTRAHIFDKRRIHFLKFGQMDQRNIGRLPPKLFRVLHHKSRDEIEQAFMHMETLLAPREYKAYTYTIFNLQQFFYESFAKTTPQMLNQDRVDDHFIKQVCNLGTDQTFWAGMRPDGHLHEYLVRYVCMYFDHDYGPKSFMEDYIRHFINSRREYGPMPKAGSVSLKEAGTVFGETKEVLKKMSRAELARLYRRQALKQHPDKGGDHEKFVKLTKAYHELLGTKK